MKAQSSVIRFAPQRVKWIYEIKCAAISKTTGQACKVRHGGIFEALIYPDGKKIVCGTHLRAIENGKAVRFK